MMMAHYRKHLKMPFLYKQQGIGTFEVWLGTAEEVATAHRGLRHAQAPLTEAELESLQKHQDVQRDWVTVVLLAIRCGIPVSRGRHLLWKDLHVNQKEIEFKMRGAPFSVSRPLPGGCAETLAAHPAEPNRRPDTALSLVRQIGEQDISRLLAQGSQIVKTSQFKDAQRANLALEEVESWARPKGDRSEPHRGFGT